jgi:hypothetical protein
MLTAVVIPIYVTYWTPLEVYVLTDVLTAYTVDGTYAVVVVVTVCVGAGT